MESIVLHGVGFFELANCADNRVERGANRVDSEHDRVDSYHNRVDSGDTHNTFLESIVLKQTACHRRMGLAQDYRMVC